MNARRRWYGLYALVYDAVEHGSVAVQQVHQATASLPFDILEQIPPAAVPTRVVRRIHDINVSTVYSSIRLSNRALRQVVDAALGTNASTETRPESAPSALSSQVPQDELDLDNLS